MENETNFTETTIVNYSKFWDKRNVDSGSDCSTPKKDEKKKEPCEQCGKMFKRQKSHKCDGMQQYECPECKKSFMNKGSWKQHIKIHEKRKNVQSNTAESKEKTRNARKNTNPCGLCKKLFANKYLLKYHMSRYHGNRSQKCNICGKTFALQFDLKHHKQTHTNKKAFNCKVCDKKFSSKYNLNGHMLIHNPSKAPFTCSKCKHPFLRKSEYNKHIQCKHSVWKCTECSRVLATKYTLKTHMQKHKGRKEYACNMCDKNFYQKNKLKLHQKQKHPKNLLTNTEAVATTMKTMAGTQILISPSVNKHQSEPLLDHNQNHRIL